MPQSHITGVTSSPTTHKPIVAHKTAYISHTDHFLGHTNKPAPTNIKEYSSFILVATHSLDVPGVNNSLEHSVVAVGYPYMHYWEPVER